MTGDANWLRACLAFPAAHVRRGEGIVKGLAKYFGDQIHVRDLACMHRGAAPAQIAVQLVPRA